MDSQLNFLSWLVNVDKTAGSTIQNVLIGCLNQLVNLT